MKVRTYLMAEFETDNELGIQATCLALRELVENLDPGLDVYLQGWTVPRGPRTDLTTNDDESFQLVARDCDTGEELRRYDTGMSADNFGTAVLVLETYDWRQRIQFIAEKRHRTR